MGGVPGNASTRVARWPRLLAYGAIALASLGVWTALYAATRWLA